MSKYVLHLKKIFSSFSTCKCSSKLNNILFRNVSRRRSRVKTSRYILFGTNNIENVYDKLTDLVGTLTLITLKPNVPNNHHIDLENEKNLEIILAMADRSLQDGDTMQAETILLVALSFAEENQMEQAVCRIYDALVNISYARGDYGAAEFLIVRIMERLQQAGMNEKDDTIITFKLKLARLYGNVGNKDLAEMGFRDCIDAQKEKLNIGPLTDKTGVLYIDLLFWYGMFLLTNGRYEEALVNIENAYSFSNKVHGVSAAQELVLLTILSELACALGDYDTALVHMLNVIVIGKNIGHPELSLSYVLLGMIYLKKEMYEKARMWCEEGGRLGYKHMNTRAQEQSKMCLERLKPFFGPTAKKEKA